MKCLGLRLWKLKHTNDEKDGLPGLNLGLDQIVLAKILGPEVVVFSVDVNVVSTQIFQYYVETKYALEPGFDGCQTVLARRELPGEVGMVACAPREADYGKMARYFGINITNLCKHFIHKCIHICKSNALKKSYDSLPLKNADVDRVA